jgi:hypothetical protein
MMGMKFTHSFLIFIALFIIGDISSTLLFLSNGGIELNPLYHTFGWIGIILSKIYVLVCFFLLKYAIEKIEITSRFNKVYTISYIFSYILCISVVLSNFTLYFTGLNLLEHIGLM